MRVSCPTCLNSFEAKRRDSGFCSGPCYRRDPLKATMCFQKELINIKKIYAKELVRRRVKRNIGEPL